MNNEQIQTEIIELKSFVKKIDYCGKSKMDASNLISEVGIFLHTLSVQFPIGAKYYIRNHSNEINITDGMNDLKTYEKSKLKKKDDHYFYSGKENIKRGINGIIRNLESQATS